MNNLLESSINDPATLKAFIKYEVLQKKSILEAYKSFCKIMGPEVMNFPDFEFWFMRFYNGQVDVNYDRSRDPEPKNLEDLPVTIVERVVKELDPIDRIMTRHASKSLRNCVDRQTIHIDKLKLIISTDSWTFERLSSGNKSLKYEKTTEGFSISSENQKVDIKRSYFISAALQDFKSWSIENFEVVDVSENHKLFGRRWSSLPNVYRETFQVKTLSINLAKDLSKFLELMKPGTLETINAHVGKWYGVSSSEQWNRTKSISIHGDPQMLGCAFVKLRHLENFDVTVRQPTDDELDCLKIAILNVPKLQKCVIRTKETIKSWMVDAAFGEKIFEEGRVKVFVPFPGSMVQLKVTHQRYQLTIEKMPFF